MRSFWHIVILTASFAAGSIVCVATSRADDNKKTNVDSKSAGNKSTVKASDASAADGTPEVATEKKKFVPPYPNREDFFAPPISVVENKQATDPSDKPKSAEAQPHVRLIGFIGPADSRRAIVEVNGKQKSIKQGETIEGVELLSLEKPTITLQWQRARWKVSMDDANTSPLAANAARMHKPIGAKPAPRTSKTTSSRSTPRVTNTAAASIIASPSKPAHLPSLGSSSFTQSAESFARQQTQVVSGANNAGNAAAGQQIFGGGNAAAGAPAGVPAAGAPGVGAPGVGAPGVGAPGVGAPGVGAPGIGAPGIGAPGVGAPGVGAPGIGAPSVGAPGISTPGGGAPIGLPTGS